MKLWNLGCKAREYNYVYEDCHTPTTYLWLITIHSSKTSGTLNCNCVCSLILRTLYVQLSVCISPCLFVSIKDDTTAIVRPRNELSSYPMTHYSPYGVLAWWTGAGLQK